MSIDIFDEKDQSLFVSMIGGLMKRTTYTNENLQELTARVEKIEALLENLNNLDLGPDLDAPTPPPGRVRKEGEKPTPEQDAWLSKSANDSEFARQFSDLPTFDGIDEPLTKVDEPTPESLDVQTLAEYKCIIQYLKAKEYLVGNETLFESIVWLVDALEKERRGE